MAVISQSKFLKINLSNGNVWLSITISLELLLRDRTKDMLALAQIMTWRHDLCQWWPNLITRASLGLNELTWLILQISNRKITSYFVHQFRCMLNLLCRKQHTNFINPEYFNIMILRDYIIKNFITLTCTCIHSKWIYAFCSSHPKNSRLACNIWVLCLVVSSRQQASVAPLFIPYAASRDVQGNIFLLISLASEGCCNSCYSRWDTILVSSSFLIVVLVATVCNMYVLGYQGSMSHILTSMLPTYTVHGIKPI